MKAILIDPILRELREVEYNGNYKSIYGLIKADLFTSVVINNNDDTIFIDDEGLINGNPYGWFEHVNYPQPLRGYGLVLGTSPEGDSIEPKITLDELRAQVTFPDDAEIRERFT